MTRREQAALLGISVRTLYRQLHEERLGIAEWLDYPEPVAPPPPPERPGAEGLPYVPLVEEPAAGLHYRLMADQLSILPDCPFRIGRHGGRGWQVAHRDDRLCERPAESKRSGHRFRPNGAGRRKNRLGG